ncbi:hypothetical protein [Agrobacterium larrymoorei]|uniref:hypothetical protein n=1 Tax=Agrobacterium larrymoorei TaxID=160699 RepID=UPI0030BA3F0D
MTFGRFISVQTACIALDAFTTWVLLSQVGLAVLLSRTIGFLSAAALAAVRLRQNSATQGGGVLSTSITLISLLVSYGMFTLLVLRNPFLHWPWAFAAAALAGLLLSLIGYWRTRHIRT